MKSYVTVSFMTINYILFYCIQKFLKQRILLSNTLFSLILSSYLKRQLPTMRLTSFQKHVQSHNYVVQNPTEINIITLSRFPF